MGGQFSRKLAGKTCLCGPTRSCWCIGACVTGHVPVTLTVVQASPTVQIAADGRWYRSVHYMRRWNRPGMLACGPRYPPIADHPDRPRCSLTCSISAVTLTILQASPTVHAAANERWYRSAHHMRRWNRPGLLASGPRGRPRMLSGASALGMQNCLTSGERWAGSTEA